jgi:hypothetical protein
MALSKLKSVFVLLIVALTANAQNDPFMDWGGDPPPAETVTKANIISGLKSVMQGQLPAGADPKKHAVHCTRENFISVISETAYNELLAAPAEKIEFILSDGTEINNGIKNGKTVSSGKTLDKGIPLIAFTASNGERVKIKYGNNGCYNPQGPLRDPDERKTTTPPPPPPTQATNPWPLAVVSNITAAPAREMTAWEYLGASGVAEAKQLNAMYNGVAIFKDGVSTGASLKTCCGNSNITTTIQQPAIQTIQPAYIPQVSTQTVVVKEGGSNFWGMFAGSALGTLGGTLLGNAINGNRGNAYIYQYPIYQQPIQQGFNYTNLNPPQQQVFNNQPIGEPQWNTSQLNGTLSFGQGGNPL